MIKKKHSHQRPSVTVLCAVILSSMMLGAALPPGRYVSESYPSTLNSNTIPVSLEALGEVPEFVAVSVQPGDSNLELEHRRAIESFRAALKTNRNARFSFPRAVPEEPKWIPFQTNLLVDLGPGEGKRRILFAYKYKGQAHDGGWSGSSIMIQRGTPTLRIVNPTNTLTSQPMIQLQGLTSRRFETLRFDQFDGNGQKVGDDAQGLGTSFPGGYEFQPSDNYFSFLDVDLSPGTNTFVFQGTDEFGNAMTTNIVIVFSTAHDHTPPVINVNWPKPYAPLSGPSFQIDGRMDDFTSSLEARIRTKEGTSTYPALVERHGFFWIEDIPLALDTNEITLTATDAAGNTAVTNFVVIGNEWPLVTMDPVNPSDLWNEFIAVKGRVTPPNYDIWINGARARVQLDGTWSSERVPVHSPSGGTATFEISALPKSGTPAKKAKVSELLSAQTSLGTNAILLNASAPACGIFKLHISETQTKAFMILASTNLTEWTPILTNLNATPGLDFTLNASNQPCLFFKLAPLP